MSGECYEAADPEGANEAERRVIDYLRAHPDFLARRPELVAELEVPHGCGAAVSLIEHQVAVLRAENRRLRRRLDELLANARHNQSLVQRLLNLSLGLFHCRDLGEVVDSVYRVLAEEFNVDLAAIRLFAPRADAAAALAELAGERGRELFSATLASGRPRCGRLTVEQLEFLFGTRHAEVASTALLPLGDAGAYGVLALGSRDPSRFHPAQGTLFLRHVGEVLTRVVAPYVAANGYGAR